ncbi:hypothetical protein [Geomesophilobacter sediminis]|uniref:O-antigen ligase domain-containing protein n=1 Tax=Geomesophilobacter sediminis TaxID=2798584 RepID=A0A8J7J6A6_9BACT|nr:hypothetical protein [Geomesophilobacter sediminis]MBJ6724271.1 hypothetical protein [Geomesophilobacter sediminis]
MMGLVIAFLLLGVAIPYAVLTFRSRLFLVYPLLAYIMLWPKVFDFLGVIQAKGEFGSIQIGDVFYLLFALVFFVELFLNDTVKIVSRHWVPLVSVALYFFYWLLHLFLLHQEGTARAALNQFRPLAYYLFLVFFLWRIREEKDVQNVIKVTCSCAVPAAAMTVLYLYLFGTGYIESILMQIPGAWYTFKNTDLRFDIINMKCYLMVAPFLFNLFFFHNVFPHWSRLVQLISLCCVVFLLLIDQSRAFLLAEAAGFALALLLLLVKGAVKFERVLKIVPMVALLMFAVVTLFLLGDSLAPGLTEKFEKRLGSISVSGVEQYQKNKEMNSLKSRLDSYTFLLNKIEGNYTFGRGLGTQIDPYGTFKRFVDSSLLMNLWSGGLIAVVLLSIFLGITLWYSWLGYVAARESFDIYFFVSSTVSILVTYVVALQDNILFFGNSVIMFLVLAALVFAQREVSRDRSLRATTALLEEPTAAVPFQLSHRQLPEG